MFQAGMIIIGAAIVLSAAITFGLRFKAERVRLKILKAQEAEQPLRHALLQAQYDALQRRVTRVSVPSTLSALNAFDDLSWDNLLHSVDLQ